MKQFIIEPLVPHNEEEEMYCAIYGTKSGDRILFHSQGGVDIGDVDEKAKKLDVAVDQEMIYYRKISNTIILIR